MYVCVCACTYVCYECFECLSYDRFTYEIAPVFTLMEDIVLTKMRECIGWEHGEGDGIFAPGTVTTGLSSPRIQIYFRVIYYLILF